jgi:excisionase family DNA binding protein
MIKNPSDYVTSAEAAKKLGFTADHIRNLIKKGKLKAEKLGRNWIIDVKFLKKIKRQRFPRAKKDKIDGSDKRQSKSNSKSS